MIKDARRGDKTASAHERMPFAQLDDHLIDISAEWLRNTQVNVNISLTNSNIQLEGSNVPSEFGCDMADCKIYKLTSTNGITGTLKLKTAYSHPGYSITSSNSYIPYVRYQKDDYNGGYNQSNVTYSYYEWTVNGVSSGTLSFGNDIASINTSLKVENITYTLKGK